MSDLLPILVSADLRAELAEAKVVGTLDGFVVQTAEQAAVVADIQRDAHRHLKDWNEKRLTVTRPLDQAKKAVDALFKPITEPLERVKKHCQDLLTDWERRKRQLELAARQEAARLSAAGNVPAAAAIVAAAKPAPQQDYGVTWVWQAKLVDARQAPVEWLALNDAAGEYCDRYKASEAIPDVPGVEFERVPRQRVKT